jgi:hypothetical protein
MQVEQENGRSHIACRQSCQFRYTFPFFGDTNALAASLVLNELPLWKQEDRQFRRVEK